MIKKILVFLISIGGLFLMSSCESESENTHHCNAYIVTYHLPYHNSRDKDTIYGDYTIIMMPSYLIIEGASEISENGGFKERWEMDRQGKSMLYRYGSSSDEVWFSTFIDLFPTNEGDIIWTFTVHLRDDKDITFLKLPVESDNRRNF